MREFREQLVLPYFIIESDPDWSMGRFTTVGWYMDLDGAEYGRHVVTIRIGNSEEERERVHNRVRKNVQATVYQWMDRATHPPTYEQLKADRKARKKARKAEEAEQTRQHRKGHKL